MSDMHNKSSLFVILCLVHLVSCNVVKFGLHPTWENREVAGISREAILSNGQLPGPTLRVKQGDEVEFNVTNLMPFETTVHFHGNIWSIHTIFYPP